MAHDFDHIAKRLWFLENGAARLIASLPAEDRQGIEQCLKSLYGVSMHLRGNEHDIRAAVEKVRRV